MRWLALVCCLALGACRTAPKDTLAIGATASETGPAAGLGSSAQTHKDGTKPKHPSRSTATALPKARDKTDACSPAAPPAWRDEGENPSVRGDGAPQLQPPAVVASDAPATTASLPLSLTVRRDEKPTVPQQPAAMDLPCSTLVARETPDAVALSQIPSRAASEKNETPSIPLWSIRTENVPHSSVVGVAPSLSVTVAATVSNRTAVTAAELPAPGVSPLEAAKSGVPLMMPPWVEEKETEWRESELERRTNQQKEREEQIQKLRRTFYRFLNVDTD